MNEHERFLAIKKIMIESDVKNAVMKPLSPATLDVIEKFINHHNLKIKLDEVIGYYDFALFGGGKKGVLLSADFLYESQNGKPQEPYWFKGLASVSLQKYDLTMVYEDGKKITFFASIYADYYADLMNKIIQLNAKNTHASLNAQKEAEEQERKRIQDEVKAEIAARLKQKAEEELRLKQKAEEELRLKQKAEEELRLKQKAEEELRLKQKSEEELRLKQKALEKKKADLEKKR